MKSIVSIIIPCYNHAQYLDVTLSSVINQTFSNWECIIVNNGSEDDTKIIAAKWCEKDSRFKYVEQENKGVSAARNKGIRISKGEFILPLDADDYIVETFLEKLTLEL